MTTNSRETHCCKKCLQLCMVVVRTKMSKLLLIINCGTAYHKSCLERRKDIKFTERSLIKCCDKDCDNVDINLKRENELLKSMISEMTKRNSLLEEKISMLENKICDNNCNTKTTYANVVTKNVNHHTKKVPPIIIKPKDEVPQGQIKQKMKSILDVTKLKETVSSIIEARIGSVIVKCDDKADSEKIITELQKVFKDDCSVTAKKLNKPRIKIVAS